MSDRAAAVHDGARTASRWARLLLAQPRLLMAVKGALAAGLAYWIAPHVPGVAAEYPYYAPLGAVLALWPTVKTSLKQGLQTLLGLAIGVMLATAVFAVQEGQPGVFAVALVVGLGTLIAGIRSLGAGRDWVLTAGLFVLLLGGANAGDYSTGYVVQIAVGVGVGVVVNLVLVPPLYTGRAEHRLRLVQASLADRADDVATVFEADWPIEDDDWERRVAVLPSTLRHVRDAVQYADESRRLNPRWLLRRRDLGTEYADLVVFERVGFHLQDLAEVSGILGRRIGRQIGIVDDLAPVVARAVRSVGEVIRRRGGDDEDAFVTARRDVEDLWQAIDGHRELPTVATSGGVSVAVSLGRIIAALDPDDTTAPRPDDEAVGDVDGDGDVDADDAAAGDAAAGEAGSGGSGSEGSGPGDAEPEVGGTTSTGPLDDPTAPRDTAPRESQRRHEAQGPAADGQAEDAPRER
jgi:hypothetical protein